MKVVLHVGAHRTATTTLQTYMYRNLDTFAGQGVAFWGPKRTRKGLFTGIQPTPGLGLNAARRARGRILLQQEKLAQNGFHTLLVSEENMIGSVRRNLRNRSLYKDVGERLARYVHAFDGRIEKVILTIRSQEHYWASAIAYGVTRGAEMPDDKDLLALVRARRSWRDVVADIACAAPQARIEVLPFERFVGRPARVVSLATDCPPVPSGSIWKNRMPDLATLRQALADRNEDAGMVCGQTGDRLMPFDATARAMLRETYADDLHWLAAGANGLATLTEDRDQTRAANKPPFGPLERGHGNDIQERRLARPG